MDANFLTNDDVIRGDNMLTDDVGFDLLGKSLGEDIHSAIQTALAGGAVFLNASDPLSIFRSTLAASIRDIETHPRGRLFQEFLWKGPYEGDGEIPQELIGKRLSDKETASVITFIYSHMVNSFKGGITELLAAGACNRPLKELQQEGEFPSNARLYVGDVVGVHRKEGKGLLKGADLSILIEENNLQGSQGITLAGVTEVKSYFRSEDRLREQLDKHIKRAKNGLWVSGKDYPGERIQIGIGPAHRVLRICVLPDDWELPRTYHFEPFEGNRLLFVDDKAPEKDEDEIIRTGTDEWRIILRWSKEALAAAAYEMTFWYMEKIGEVIYKNKKNRPKEWMKMTPAEAGKNAATMMLYYAILRCNTAREDQRAIALYNSYGFGYSLGMNFMNAEGKREMLWAEDLDELLEPRKERTSKGCWIKKTIDRT